MITTSRHYSNDLQKTLSHPFMDRHQAGGMDGGDSSFLSSPDRLTDETRSVPVGVVRGLAVRIGNLSATSGPHVRVAGVVRSLNRLGHLNLAGPVGSAAAAQSRQAVVRRHDVEVAALAVTCLVHS